MLAKLFRMHFFKEDQLLEAWPGIEEVITFLNAGGYLRYPSNKNAGVRCYPEIKICVVYSAIDFLIHLRER